MNVGGMEVVMVGLRNPLVDGGGSLSWWCRDSQVHFRVWFTISQRQMDQLPGTPVAPVADNNALLTLSEVACKRAGGAEGEVLLPGRGQTSPSSTSSLSSMSYYTDSHPDGGRQRVQEKEKLGKLLKGVRGVLA